MSDTRETPPTVDPCRHCDGTGYTMTQEYTGYGYERGWVTERCPRCMGIGGR